MNEETRKLIREAYELSDGDQTKAVLCMAEAAIIQLSEINASLKLLAKCTSNGQFVCGKVV